MATRRNRSMVMMVGLLLSLLLVTSVSVEAQQGYWAGKTLTVIIGYPPGGSTDIQGRLIAEHLPRFLPGNPRVQVRNMSGGSSIAAANLMYNVVAPDGLTIAAPGPGAWIPAFALGDPAVEFDPRNFVWIGGMGNDDLVVGVNADTGITSLDDLKTVQKTFLFGSWAKNATPYTVPELLREELDLNIQTVAGYDGAGSTLLALERGEVQGAAILYSAFTRTAAARVESGEIRFIARLGRLRDLGPEVVHLDEILSPLSVQLLNFMAPRTGVAMLAPPGTPPEIAKQLQDAFAEMVKDPKFIEEAARRDALINYQSPEALLATVTEIAEISPEVIAKYKALTAD